MAAAAWILVPDEIDDGQSSTPLTACGALIATFMGFFLAEIGDKTQIATVALAARFEMLVPVAEGTTLGMLRANVPVVLLGNRAAHRIPIAPIRIVAALLFGALGLHELP